MIGIIRSGMIASGAWRCAAANPREPSSAASTSYPFHSRIVRTTSTIARSSSITRTRVICVVSARRRRSMSGETRNHPKWLRQLVPSGAGRRVPVAEVHEPAFEPTELDELELPTDAGRQCLDPPADDDGHDEASVLVDKAGADRRGCERRTADAEVTAGGPLQ